MNKRIIGLVAILTMVLVLLPGAVTFADTGRIMTFNVMGPLHVKLYNDPAPSLC